MTSAADSKRAPSPEEENPLVAIFQDDGIRIMGSVKSPEFCAKDVAEYIGDANYVRTLKSYGTDATEETGAYICTALAPDTNGRQQSMLYLTEKGLYRYLLRSDLPGAIKFQSYVYDILQAERERVVDSVMLALKIERTQKAELQRQLDQSKASYRASRIELSDAFRAANDARAECKTANIQLKRLQTQQRGGASARIAAAEEANRTRSWMANYRPVE
jgi:prophage antirepressor-like protein